MRIAWFRAVVKAGQLDTFDIQVVGAIVDMEKEAWQRAGPNQSQRPSGPL
jgi:hypothetical protein